jgi:flavin reductase (DIM6/NTAB) family NADH-FMN oxidoreductase RutF
MVGRLSIAAGSEGKEPMKPSIGAINCLYPLPTTLVGVNVDDKPNYIAIAHVGVMALRHISVSMNKRHYSNAGIIENKCFSVNLPSVDLVRETDYCGLVSGREADKAALFTTFYGQLGAAPMIAECAINMECQLVRTIDFETHDVFVGRVVETYCEECYFADGDAGQASAIDLAKVQPLLFAMLDRSYWSVGERVARAWDAGKELQ